MIAWLEGDRKLRNNDIVGAIETFSEGIQAEPHDIQNYFGRAKAYYLTGDLNAAIADLTQAIDIQPDNNVGYYRRAQIYCSASGQYNTANAIADYTRAIDLYAYD